MSILREELITNHLLLDYFEMWEEFDISKVEDPNTIRYYDLIMNLVEGQLDASIEWLESDEGKAYFFGETEYQHELFQALEDEWDEILSGKYPSVDALLDEVYRKGKSKGYADMRERIRYSEADTHAIRLARDYNYHLIRRIDDDTRNQIRNKISEAVIAGEHPYTVAPKILKIADEKLEGSNFTPRQRATMIARTEMSRVKNTGVLQSYVNEGYTEVKILTAGDDNVCTTCLEYAFKFDEADDITYETRGKERVHNIIELIKGGKFPPFHPLCRCTYLSVWSSKGEPPEDPYIVDLTPESNPLTNPPELKPVPELKTPKQVADYYGLKYEPELDKRGNIKSYNFRDKDYNCELRIDKHYTKEENNLIDLTNSGNAKYNLEEVVRYYVEAPPLLKHATNEISFVKSRAKRVAGRAYLVEYNPKKIKIKPSDRAKLATDIKVAKTKFIKINPKAFEAGHTDAGNLRHVILHEMNHCLDYSYISKERADILLNPNEHTYQQLMSANNGLQYYYGISGIHNQMGKPRASREDAKYQRENNLPVSPNASKYGGENSAENWAETGAMSSYYQIDDKSMAVIRISDDEDIDWDEWIKRHPNKYEEAVNIFENGDPSQFTFR